MHPFGTNEKKCLRAVGVRRILRHPMFFGIANERIRNGHLTSAALSDLTLEGSQHLHAVSSVNDRLKELDEVVSGESETSPGESVTPRSGGNPSSATPFCSVQPAYVDVPFQRTIVLYIATLETFCHPLTSYSQNLATYLPSGICRTTFFLYGISPTQYQRTCKTFMMTLIM